MPTISTESLIELLEQPEAVLLLDVREPDEFAAWRIPGSVNVPLGELGATIGEIPRGRRIVTVCAAGVRAERAAEALGRRGIDAGVLEGGMGAWADTYDTAAVELEGATVVQVRRRGKGCLSYLVGADGAAAVIDPSSDVDRYVDLAEQRGWRISHVLETHLHADHLSGARALAAATGAELALNPSEAYPPPHADLRDGQLIGGWSGGAAALEVMHTPGHTPGSTSYLLGDAAVFSGDVLFLESVGRPDLLDCAEEFAHDLYRSLHHKLLALPDDALVLPAHYGDAVSVHAGEMVAGRLGALRERLGMLALCEDDFVAWAAGSVVERPPNAAEIVRANEGRSVRQLDELRALEQGPNRCALIA